MMSPLPSGTVTFLFTDIEGSTKIAQQYPQQWETLHARHHALLYRAMQAYNGYVFQIIGDAFCVAFHTATDALNAAVLAQRLFLQEPWNPAPIKVRIGINTGTAQVSGDDPRSGGYTGYTSLVRVQRVMSVAYGEQILLSNTSAELVRVDFPDGVTLRDLGEHRLKGLLNPEHLWQVTTPDLPQDFPPLQSLNAIPNNLPVQLTSFIGREQEMARVNELLDSTRLLSLTGAGGSGKTRLALQVAADLIDEFPDGVWFVELAPLTDPGLIPQTVASLLGLREEAGRPAMTMLSDYLRAKTTLLLLDNCEHLIDACAKFADTILHAAPKVKILATSREALGIAGETAYRVPSLSLPPIQSLTSNVQLPTSSFQSLTQYESVRLFIDRALAVKTDFSVTNANAPAVAQICHRLDGIPLALELAAARVKSLSVDQIAARLDDRFRLLTGGSRTALPRQQTLRAAIDWSFSLLTDAERILLRRLSVFAGGWTLEAAKAVYSCDPVCADDVLDLLARLVDKSLVIFEQRDSETRYRLMETIRQYSRDKLLESGEMTIVRGRHLDFFLKFAQDAEPELDSPEQFKCLNRFDSEHDNLRVALEWSLSDSQTDKGLELATALRKYWQMRANWSEGRDLVDHLLAHRQSASKNLIRVNGLLVGGYIHWQLGDNKKSRQYLEELVPIARELGEVGKQPLAIGLGYLSRIVYGENPRLSESLIEEGLAIARSLGIPWVIAYLVLYQGFFQADTDDFVAAQKSFEEALSLYQSMGDKRNAAWAMGRIGSMIFNQHDYVTSRQYVESSLRLAREMRDPQGIYFNLVTLGEIERVQGNYDAAQRNYIEGLKIARDRGRMQGIPIGLSNLGAVALYKGETITAKSLYAEALALARQLNSQERICFSLMGIATVMAVEKKTRHAVQLLAVYRTFIESGDVRNTTPADEQEYERYLAMARAQLDEATFNAAWAEGKAMTLEQAIDLALKDE